MDSRRSSRGSRPGDRCIRRSAAGLLAIGSLTLAVLARAGGDTEVLTPGWDAFPGLTSGSVAWTVAAGSRDFNAIYVLAGATPSQEHLAGFHSFDVDGPVVFGGGSSGIGRRHGELVAREGNTSVVTDTSFGFVAVDGAGAANRSYAFSNVNPGVYGVQFHLRQGGAPGCPTTSCNVIYRSGALFAGELARFAIPGAAGFWSGDGDLEDEVGSADASTVGSTGFRAGRFRQGFDLTGSGHLSVPNPAANGLASASGFTVAAWIEQDSFVSSASVLNLRTPANSSGYTLEAQFQNPGVVLFAVNVSGSTEFAFVTGSGFPAGQRFFVAASFDAATHTLRLYRGADLVAERTDVPGTNMVLLGNEQMNIGRNIVTGAAFDGLIDEVLYFDRTLSPDDVRAISGAAVFANGFE